jgi:arylsulfatase A-like enzyme
LGAGTRVPAIVQPVDLVPTVLEFLDVPVPPSVQGRSLWPLVRGEVERLRRGFLDQPYDIQPRAGSVRNPQRSLGQ